MAKIANWMGHSGAEPGAHGILQEDDVTRQARTWSVDYMRACGHTVITDQDNMTLRQRISASAGADAIIEWHANLLGTGKAFGTEAWYSQYDTGRGVKAAQAVTAAAAKFGFANRGAKNSKTNRYGRLGILDDPKPVAILVELFFLDNPGDVQRWKANGKVFVEAMTSAFLASLGFKSSPASGSTKPTAPAPKPAAKPWTIDVPAKAAGGAKITNPAGAILYKDSTLKTKNGRTLKAGSIWAVAAIKDGSINLGGDQWINGKDAILKLNRLATDHTAGGVAIVIADDLWTQAKPSAGQPGLKHLNKGTTWQVFGSTADFAYLDGGGDQWIDSKKVKIRL